MGSLYAILLMMQRVKSSLMVSSQFVKKSGIKIIAEYVHNEAVQKKIKELEIDYSQGYYFGKPCAELVKNY